MKAVEVLIYSEEISNRLIYALNVLFERFLAYSYTITHDAEYFNQSTLPKINYSSKLFNKAINIEPASLLFSKGIFVQDEKFSVWEGLPVLFSSEKDAGWGFDIFAASFYLLSRYEEYLPFQADQHGRYSAKLSTACRNGFLEKPVIQCWLNKLEAELRRLYPSLPASEKRFRFQPTIDVDTAFAFWGRNFSRTFLASVRDFLTLRWNSFFSRFLVFSGIKSDPFDTYSLIVNIHKADELKPLFFYQIGTYGKFDKNIDRTPENLESLLLFLTNEAEVAIHPSYKTQDSFEELMHEKQYMEQLIQQEIVKSRQHYLRLSFPSTYRNLIKAGITDDYSMGYHDAVGFRAGTCEPFPFYDLEKEETTTLVIHPFVLMDRTLKDYMQLDVDAALFKIQMLVNEVKAVNGLFTSLWHNDALSNFGEWKGWVYAYLVMLSLGRDHKETLTTLKEEISND